MPSSGAGLDAAKVHSFDGFASELSDLPTRVFVKNTFDFLINIAGIGVTCPSWEITEKQFYDLINTHVKGVFFLTQKLCNLLADNGGIVNISTGLTRFTVPGANPYLLSGGDRPITMDGVLLDEINEHLELAGFVFSALRSIIKTHWQSAGGFLLTYLFRKVITENDKTSFQGVYLTFLYFFADRRLHANRRATACHI